jgi:hypothetical protein
VADGYDSYCEECGNNSPGVVWSDEPWMPGAFCWPCPKCKPEEYQKYLADNPGFAYWVEHGEWPDDLKAERGA